MGTAGQVGKEKLQNKTKKARINSMGQPSESLEGSTKGSLQGVNAESRDGFQNPLNPCPKGPTPPVELYGKS